MDMWSKTQIDMKTKTDIHMYFLLNIVFIILTL